MAQPPPRKDAYSKFIVNLHKVMIVSMFLVNLISIVIISETFQFQEHHNNLQGKNQSELDLLDDITKFMKQKAAIEKSYAEGLLKLSSVYGSKKIANKVGVDSKESKDGADQQDSGSSQNIFHLWLKVLEENEKVANLRLAAAQVISKA